jgi:hypothetical protein
MNIIMTLSDLDFILLWIIGYGLGVATGLCFCVKNRDAFLVRSKSYGNLKEVIAAPTILASAPMPPPHNPVKLTIE